MLFNSLAFGVFLPIVFLVYWWLGNRYYGTKAQNVFLILSGYFFYGWWDPRFLVLLFVATAVDFWVGLQIGKYKDRKPPFWVLGISLAMNLGMLGTFKYFDFFSRGLVDMLAQFGVQAHLPLLNILLPVGISFYTFQTLSYTIDVYRGKLQATTDPIAFFAFVAFFPPLVAGPIERATHLLPQVIAPRKFSYPGAVVGLRLILWGIFKKVVIADALAPFVGFVFKEDASVAAVDVILGTVMFAVQLYCDFSGYTDVARGSARLLGFELAINFDRPYFAASLHEFWARWHISLSSWFRDYLYVSLGGNRKGLLRAAFNIFLVFLVSGLWHGAATTFVIWGAIHGFWYIVERQLKLPKRLPRFLLRGITLSVILFGYIFFRAGKFSIASNLVAGLGRWGEAPLLFRGIETDLAQIWPIGFVLLYFAGLIAFLFVNDALFDFSKVDGRFSSLPKWTRWGYYYLLIAWLLLLGAYGAPQQFIYFQF